MAEKKARTASASGKAPKPPKDETHEQRTLRMEMEALAAEERARTEAELARVMLSERASREQHAAHLNSIKIHNQWRKIMRSAKVEELRRQVEILSQDHARQLDRKDALVQLLDHDLEAAEQQHQTALAAHLLVVDSLIDLQAARLSGLEQQYTTSLREMLAEAASERAELTASHARVKKDVQDMAAAMKAEFGGLEADARQEYEAVREEVRNRNSEQYNVLKIQLEGIIDELERHFGEAHKAYLQGTEHRTAAFKKLTSSDAAAAHAIEQRMRRLVKLQEDLQHWRTKTAANTREWEARNAALRHEKEQMARHYARLKAALEQGRAAAAERLKQLSLMSGGTIQELQARLSKAERVLKLSGMCRKLETEQEKVLPFWGLDEAVPTPQKQSWQQHSEQQGDAEQQFEQQQQQQQQQHGSGPDEQQLVAQQQEEGGARPPTNGATQPPCVQQPCWSAQGLDESGQPVSDWDYLNRFYRRYNKAVLDGAAASKERSRLEQENADLRQLLKAFLDGVSVNDAVIKSPVNPLLVINQRLQATMAKQRQQQGGQAGSLQQQQHRQPGSASGPVTARSVLSAAAATALSGSAALAGVAGQSLVVGAPPGGLVMSPRTAPAPVSHP